MPLASLPPSPLLKPGADPLELLGLTSAGGLSPADLLEHAEARGAARGAGAPAARGVLPAQQVQHRAADDEGGAHRRRWTARPTARRTSWCCRARTRSRSVKERTAAGTWRMTGVDTSQGRIDLAPGGIVVIALGTIETRADRARLVRRQRPPDAAVHRQEPDRAPALEPGVPRAPGCDPRTVGDDQRAADRGAVREGPRDAGERRPDRTVPSADRGQRRRQHGRRRGRAVPQDPGRRFLRPAAQLHGHACGLRDPRPGRDGGGGSDRLRRASEPRGPRPARRRVRRAARHR